MRSSPPSSYKSGLEVTLSPNCPEVDCFSALIDAPRERPTHGDCRGSCGRASRRSSSSTSSLLDAASRLRRRCVCCLSKKELNASAPPALHRWMSEHSQAAVGGQHGIGTTIGRAVIIKCSTSISTSKNSRYHQRESTQRGATRILKLTWQRESKCQTRTA